MKKNKLFFAFFFAFVLFLQAQVTFAQIHVAGKWKSDSGNIFFIVDTQEGFKYQNTTTKTWFFAKWQNNYDYNKYVVYAASDNSKVESYVTVKQENGSSIINIYNALTGKSNKWTKIED
ncbi:MAG: hypothetical protein SFU27_01585 [Thermonemataceae bacterium]|nr:hypothetical protein [Thermonemataceae bacterium]